MLVRVVTDQPWDVRADVLAIPLLDEPAWDGILGELDRRSDGSLRGAVEFGELKSDLYASTMLANPGQTRILAVGAGRTPELTRQVVVRVGSAIERRLSGRNVRSLAVWVGDLAGVEGGLPAAVELVARGVVEGSYEPAVIYREDATGVPPQLEELILIVPPEGDRTALTPVAERGVVIGEGTNFTRTLAQRSANDVSPEVLAEEARSVAEKAGVSVDIIGPDRAAELGMGLFLAVGRGSDNPPRMIVLRSGAEGARDAQGRLLALVGKGVCFDSGGISIKPADRMEEMKMDKTGACTVIAAMATVARLAPGMPLLAIAPAVENMPGPHSTRPGDVVRGMNGKWVDIINTDAEGRLILADAMTYAERLGATHIVDVATLTGAVSRALGDQMTGAFGTPQPWYDDVAAASRSGAERMWQLPLVDDYRSELDSVYANIVNSGSAEGSLVKSAIFLREFVTVPWVHLDIAGTAYFRKTKPYAPKGATGVSHATLVELALQGAGQGS